jgi:hypothetical protein
MGTRHLSQTGIGGDVSASRSGVTELLRGAASIHSQETTTVRGRSRRRARRPAAPAPSQVNNPSAISVTWRRGRDEGRSGKISAACGASNKGHEPLNVSAPAL